MALYTVKLAWRSLVATPWLSLVAVVAIALGVAVPTTIISLRHVFARDPIPAKSDVLYNVRVDNWDPNSQFFDIKPGDPPKHITYRDMLGLRASEVPVYDTGVANAAGFVFPSDPTERPFRALIRLCHADFFPMFQVPFRFGSGWSAGDDSARAHVVVLSRATNQRLFGGRDSTGETIRLGTGDFTVVGVLDRFRPLPQYYDVINNAMGEPRDLFVPFDVALEESLGFEQRGDTDGWGSFDFASREEQLRYAEFNWIQYWVELAPGTVGAYRDWVDAYTREEQAHGRFPKPLNNRVTPLMEWLRVRDVVPPQTEGMIVIAVLFMLVCCLNLLGLLLAKFLSRAGILGVHRALGASRGAVFFQRLTECELIGVAGGLLGAGLTVIALRVCNRVFTVSQVAAGAFAVDGFALLLAIGLALVAGFASGLYPAWRACRVAPAIQLKIG